MHSRGQTTTFQTRLEISEHAEARVEQHTHRNGRGVLNLDRTQVATTLHSPGTSWLNISSGPSGHWSTEYLSQGIKGNHPSLAQAPSRLGTSHPFSGTQDGCLLVRPAAPESSRHSQAPQTHGLDAPLSTASRPTPTTAPNTPNTPHQEWQMDAQGIMQVEGVGKVSLITIVDVTSRLKAESYPGLETTNPALCDYQLALRRAFLTYGLPGILTLDHGTVFYDNTTPSPFPTRLHLWLLALGVQVHFTRKRCPTDHAIIERTHQTMTAQALLGQTYSSPAALWAGLDERRQVLNHHLPSRALAHQAPLEAYPHAIHSGRSYRPEWEEELLSLEQVCSYLAQGRWFRSIRTNGFFDLGGYRYYLGKHFAHRSVAIGFDPDAMVLICQPEGCEDTLQMPIQGITKAELMGELALLQALPVYQLALPFSLAAWRQLEYAHDLRGTTW